MSQIPDNLKYTKDHEWVRFEEDGTAVIGITDYAQSSLGDVTFVELPEIEDSFDAGESFGVVESVKAASDLYMPLTGTVVAVNEALADAPESVNSDPYGDAWMIRIKPDGEAEAGDLLEPPAYAEIAD
ncbi:MAG: glycine cleavage system protein GcvH [Verrucomicrobia bacterium]|jgi:glycine cleavage system H protein|nr:glycine cleavage system protein GcvH [Verrucomicrobiota bacterium]